MGTRRTSPKAKDTAGLPTRERIIQAAEKLFAERGFAGVSMPEIARTSGITAGAIYKHFESKAALFFEIVYRTVKAAPVAGLRDAKDLPAVLSSQTTRDRKQVRQFAVEVHYAAAKDRRAGQLLRGALDAQIGDIRRLLAAGQATGEVEAGHDPDLLAHAVFIFLMGLMHMETLAPRLVGDPDWKRFIEDRTAALAGLTSAGRGDG